MASREMNNRTDIRTVEVQTSLFKMHLNRNDGDIHSAVVDYLRPPHIIRYESILNIIGMIIEYKTDSITSASMDAETNFVMCLCDTSRLQEGDTMSIINHLATYIESKDSHEPASTLSKLRDIIGAVCNRRQGGGAIETTAVTPAPVPGGDTERVSQPVTDSCYDSSSCEDMLSTPTVTQRVMMTHRCRSNGVPPVVTEEPSSVKPEKQQPPAPAGLGDNIGASDDRAPVADPVAKPIADGDNNSPPSDNTDDGDGDMAPIDAGLTPEVAAGDGDGGNNKRKEMDDSDNKQEPAAKKKKTKVPREYMNMPEIKIPDNCDDEQVLHNIIYSYTKDFTCGDYKSLNENKKWNNEFKGMLNRMWDIKSNLSGQTHENFKNYINARTTVKQFVDYMDVVFKSQTVSK